MSCGMLRLIARRRRCSVIRACAMDTHDGEVESEGYERPAQLEMHPDIRAWCYTRMVFYARGTTNLVRNAVCRHVLGDCTIQQLLVNGFTSLAYRRPQVGDVMQAQVLWDLVLGILPAL